MYVYIYLYMSVCVVRLTDTMERNFEVDGLRNVKQRQKELIG
jgi:hypothetical protein